jgi:hypothetical protein
MADLLSSTANTVPQPSKIPGGDASTAMAVKRLQKLQQPLKQTGRVKPPGPLPVLRKY